MPRASLSRSFAAILPALLLTFGAGARTIILCVGAGGHFAIEQADIACCHPEERTGGAADALTTKQDRCATGCTDTPLGIIAACSVSERTSLKVPLLALAALPLPVAVAFTGIIPAAARPGLVAAASPRALRTTVILC